MIYYRVLKDIIQLAYHGRYKPILFKCDWVKLTQQSVHVDKESNFKMVNPSNVSSFKLFDKKSFILTNSCYTSFLI